MSTVDENNLRRTPSGDEMLALLVSNRQHPEVRAFIAEFRRQSNTKKTDDEILDMLTEVLMTCKAHDKTVKS